MRLTNEPLSAEDFEDVLDDAVRGIVLTDQGTNDEVDNALSDVALDPSLDNIVAARVAFARMTPPERV